MGNTDSRAEMRYDDLRVVIGDDQGNRFDGGTPHGVMTSSDMLTIMRVEGWCPAAFPRRGKNLHVYYYERGKSNSPLVADFLIPNPAPGNYPTWTPEALPATRTNEGLSVSLITLKSGLSRKDKTKPAASNEIAVAEAAFRIIQAGRETNAWRPKAVEIWDATGNHWTTYPNTISSRRENGMDYFSFDGGLWPGEAAWKMRFEISRVADYLPDEVFTFSGIIVPGATQVINLENSTNIDDSKVRLMAITGDMAEQPGNLKWSTIKKHSNISISITPFPEGWRLALLKVTDDTGREAEIKREADWNSPQRVYGFKVPAGAKSLNFTFALHQSRFVEFMAKPEFAKAN
jgi:hypothetical protein